MPFAPGLRWYREPPDVPRAWVGSPRAWLTRWTIIFKNWTPTKYLITWGTCSYDDTARITHHVWFQGGLHYFCQSVGLDTDFLHATLPNEVIVDVDWSIFGLDPDPFNWPTPQQMQSTSDPNEFWPFKVPHPNQGRWNNVRGMICAESGSNPLLIASTSLLCYMKYLNNCSANSWPDIIEWDHTGDAPYPPDVTDQATIESALQGLGFNTDPLMWSVQDVVPFGAF